VLISSMSLLQFLTTVCHSRHFLSSTSLHPLSRPPTPHRMFTVCPSPTRALSTATNHPSLVRHLARTPAGPLVRNGFHGIVPFPKGGLNLWGKIVHPRCKSVGLQSLTLSKSDPLSYLKASDFEKYEKLKTR
jgi:hypothetical protein